MSFDAATRGHAFHRWPIFDRSRNRRIGDHRRPSRLWINSQEQLDRARKRRDEHAHAGSDVVRDRPRSVLSGATLEELLDGSRRRST